MTVVLILLYWSPISHFLSFFVWLAWLFVCLFCSFLFWFGFVVVVVVLVVFCYNFENSRMHSRQKPDPILAR